MTNDEMSRADAPRARQEGLSSPTRSSGWSAEEIWDWLSEAERERALALGQSISLREPPVHWCPRCGHECHP